MDKKEFIRLLDKRLSFLTAEERKRVRTYYQELIEDDVESGRDEADFIKTLGSLDWIEANIAADIDFHTSNGGINLTVVGSFDSYRVTMATSNGKYYLDGVQVAVNSYHTNLPHQIKLATSNGDVRLAFASI